MEFSRLTFKERQRRMADHLDDVMEASKMGTDPGLRREYSELPRLPLTIIACAMGKSINQGGILRTAEAYRVDEVLYEPEEDLKTDFSGGTGAWDWQPFTWMEPKAAIRHCQDQGKTVYALSLAPDAIPLHEVHWQFPAALVLGEEKNGIPAKTVALCDQCVAIPLYGLVTSLNVATACALALQSAVEQYTKQDPDFIPARVLSRRLLGLS